MQLFRKMDCLSVIDSNMRFDEEAALKKKGKLSDSFPFEREPIHFPKINIGRPHVDTSLPAGVPQVPWCLFKTPEDGMNVLNKYNDVAFIKTADLHYTPLVLLKRMWMNCGEDEESLEFKGKVVEAMALNGIEGPDNPIFVLLSSQGGDYYD